MGRWGLRRQRQRDFYKHEKKKGKRKSEKSPENPSKSSQNDVEAIQERLDEGYQQR
jgi:hypothetical protein